MFGDTEIRYTKPATRLDGHMAGYDLATAPALEWPARLAAAKQVIRKLPGPATSRPTSRRPT